MEEWGNYRELTEISEGGGPAENKARSVLKDAI